MQETKNVKAKEKKTMANTNNVKKTWTNEEKKHVNDVMSALNKAYMMQETYKPANFEKVETTKGGSNCIGCYAINGVEDANTTSRRCECYLIGGHNVVVWCGVKTPIYDIMQAHNVRFTGSGTQRRYVISYNDIDALLLITYKVQETEKSESKAKTKKRTNAKKETKTA